MRRDLRGDYFFQFSVNDTDEDPVSRDLEKGEVFSARNPTGDEYRRRTARSYVTAKPLSEQIGTRHTSMFREERCCQSHPKHSRKVRVCLWWQPVGDDLSEFIPEDIDILGQAILLRGDVAARLRTTSFTGYRLDVTRPLDSAGNDVKLSHPVLELQFMGRRCDEILISETVANKCPFCGRGPIACSECRLWCYPACPVCHREYDGEVEQPDGTLKLVNRLDGLVKYNSRILVGRDWDGSDFHGGASDNPRYISKRVLQWLLSFHAAPFSAVPVTIDVEGMTKEQLEKLETMKLPTVGMRK